MTGLPDEQPNSAGPGPASDAEGRGMPLWIQRVARGDDQALASLYDASSAMVFGVALRMLRDHADAEEVTLDVYKYVWGNAGDYNLARGTVIAWLLMLVRSRCLDRIRTRESRQRAEEPARPVTTAVQPDVVPNRQSGAVREALSNLPGEQAELIELAYFSGLSHSELAERTGLPLGTVKTRLRLALQRLRNLLEEWKP
jgi:RNA polymerase sigma-70 factor, ECF subfamily